MQTNRTGRRRKSTTYRDWFPTPFQGSKMTARGEQLTLQSGHGDSRNALHGPGRRLLTGTLSSGRAVIPHESRRILVVNSSCPRHRFEGRCSESTKLYICIDPSLRNLSTAQKGLFLISICGSILRWTPSGRSEGTLRAPFGANRDSIRDRMHQWYEQIDPKRPRLVPATRSSEYL